jgi:tRNA(fMet)-specific endonuclease VapC
MIVRFLIDTNAASYVINKKNAAMDRRLAEVPMPELGVSAITEGELRYGSVRSGSLRLQATVDQFLAGVTVLPWDSHVAQAYGRIRATLEREGHLLGSLEMMIAAQAIALDLVLVTADRAFARIKHLQTEDWTRP